MKNLLTLILFVGLHTPAYIIAQHKVSSGDHIVPELVLVEGGEFNMGSNYGEIDEEPIHSVVVNNFYIGRYEITNKQYATFLNLRRPAKRDVETWINVENDRLDITRDGQEYVVAAGRENYPVTSVSWYGASAYCEWLRNLTGEPFRLPTEAEWEYAARGGKKTHDYVYSGSRDVGEVAWFDWNADGEKHEVGTLKPNELTTYDMIGNVQEWCNDWYDEHFYEDVKETPNNPAGPEKGYECVVRGGAFHLEIENVRNEDRSKFAPHIINATIGFRIAREYDGNATTLIPRLQASSAAADKDSPLHRQ